MQNEELRKANIEIQQARDRYFKLYNLAPVGFFSFLPDGTIIDLNTRFVHLLHREKELILNTRFQVYLNEKSLEIFQNFCYSLDFDGHIQYCELQIDIGNHKFHTFQIDGYKTHDNALHQPKMYASAVDISQRKILEQSMLRNSQLESLGLLAGGIAHDFNNILTAIQGNISLAQMSADSVEDMVSQMKEAEQAINRAKGLTSQLLTFAKGGSLVKKVTDISALVKSAVHFALSGSNIQCTIGQEDSIPYSFVDENQIFQVFTNLVRNAREAMEQGGILEVRLNSISIDDSSIFPLTEGSYIKISVEDHGPGIPDHVSNKVFDPYFTTKKNGIGLGLPICYSIIRKHNGYITFKSDFGKGTTFDVYLLASTSQELDAPIISKSPIIHTNKRILFMDDEQNICTVVAKMLKKLGYLVEIAFCGEEALAKYQTFMEEGRKFDGVIMDLTIRGGMGGEETIKHLRKLDQEAKVIVASGYSANPVLKEYRAFGFDGVVRKPYTILELSEGLQNLFNI